MMFRRRPSGESDAVLVSRAAKGDEPAFRELLDRHQGPVYGFAHRLLKDPREAEDIAQEVFLRLYRTAGTSSFEASVRGYLFRIARNLCIDALRKKKPELMDELPETIDPNTAFDRLDQAESMQRLLAAVSDLPANQQTAVLLRHEQGMNYKEIADALGVSVSAAESLLVRARRTLRDRLPDLRGPD